MSGTGAWQRLEFGKCADLVNGRAYAQTELLESGPYQVIRIQNLNGGASWYYSDLELDDDKYCESGDVLFAWSATFGPYVWSGKKAIYHYHIWKVLPKPEHLDKEFSYFLLLWITAKIKAAAHGIAMLHFTKEGMERYEVAIPPVSTQRRLAARLQAQMTEVEIARRAAKAQSDESEALLAAIYREAFMRVLPVAVPPTFDEPPAGWRWRKLTDVARLESGHTPSRSRPDWWGGDVSWISLTEIRALDGQWVESTKLRTNAAGIANSAARILPRGTVCYSRTASVGFVAIMAKPMATSQDFANWVCGDALDPEFLMHALIRARKELRDLATGATHKTIYMPTLESFHVCAPDIDAQRRIVRGLKQQLGEASALRTALDTRQAELSRLPQRLLAQAFEN